MWEYFLKYYFIRTIILGIWLQLFFEVQFRKTMKILAVRSEFTSLFNILTHAFMSPTFLSSLKNCSVVNNRNFYRYSAHFPAIKRKGIISSRDQVYLVFFHWVLKVTNHTWWEHVKASPHVEDLFNIFWI